MKKKNQHFVPKFYFRFFSLDGKSISLIKKKDGECKHIAPIKSQSSGNFFYGSVEVEDAIGELEGHLKLVLKKLNDCKSLSELGEADVHTILVAVVFQHERTLAARTKMLPAYNKFMRLFAELEIGKDDSLSDEEKSDFISKLPLLELDAVRPQLEAISHAMHHAHILLDLAPILLENKTTRPFIFGDAPVVFHNSYCENVSNQGVLGFASSGLQIIFPLSEKRALMLIDRDQYKIKGVYKNNFLNVKILKDVESINRLQFLSASSAVYFSDLKYESYVSHIWSLDKEKISNNEVRIVESVACDNGEDEVRELVHSFVPLLPIKLRLSFLDHEILSDENYVPSLRKNCLIEDGF